MKKVCTGREAYEELVKAGETLFESKVPNECTAEEIEQLAELGAGSFERFFDDVRELAGVVADRLTKRTMEVCGQILSGQGTVLGRVDEMFAYWEAASGQLDRLREAAGEIPAMKGHILTCLDVYTGLADALAQLLQTGMEEGKCAVSDPRFAANAIAFGLLSSRYAGHGERALISMVRGAFDSMLLGGYQMPASRAS